MASNEEDDMMVVKLPCVPPFFGIDFPILLHAVDGKEESRYEYFWRANPVLIHNGALLPSVAGLL